MFRLKSKAAIFLVAAILLSLASCAGAGKKTVSFTAMDTVMSVTAWSVGDDALDAAKATVAELESELSVTAASSAVARANVGERVTLSENAAELCRRSLDMCRKTGGALDISVYPLVRAWGFATGEASEAKNPADRVPTQSEIDSLLSRVGYDRVSIADDGTLSLADGAMIDFGAVAKGYAADLICGELRSRGASAAIVDLGGCVRAVGQKPDGSEWKIAVASPTGEGNVCTVAPGEAAVVTSGSYERYFEADGKRYCHIIDPKTGYPVDGGLLSVTVIGESAFVCDALSTALFVLGEDGAAAYWRDHGGFEMILVTADGVSATPGIAPKVALAEGERMKTLR